MPEKDWSSELSSKASEVSGQLNASLSNASAGVREKASELTQKAADTIDSNRGSAAGSLDSVATSLHDHAGSLPGGEKVATLAHGTADKLGATAEYVRSHDTKAMMADLEAFVKAHPVHSLVAAAVVGLFVGRSFQRRD